MIDFIRGVLVTFFIVSAGVLCARAGLSHRNVLFVRCECSIWGVSRLY